MNDEAQEAHWALRLTFRVDGDDIELIDQERVQMVAPPSDDLDEDVAHSGFWHELQDAKGQPLYRRVIANPLARHVEVPTGDPDEPLARREIDRPSGLFTVVLPDVPDADAVVLFASKPEPLDEGPSEKEPKGPKDKEPKGPKDKEPKGPKGKKPKGPKGKDPKRHERGFEAKEVARFDLPEKPPPK